MKAIIKLKRFEVHVEGDTQKEVFAATASAIDVFGEGSCALCQSENIVPVVRRVKDGKREYDYHEWQCTNPQCRAKLALGSNLEGGTLFPKRKLDANSVPSQEGNYGPHRGWHRYKREA